MTLWAIDPGTTQSAFVVLKRGRPDFSGILPNGELMNELDAVGSISGDLLAVEMIASYGMPVGREVFETCVWIGRFIEAWQGRWRYVYRREVKSYLCNSMQAKDGNVRQALIDRYPAEGGGRVPQIGTKKEPGPLYGFKSHLWAALGVALTAQHLEGLK